MILDAPLETERLALRSLTADDVTDRYVAWLRDPDINRYLEIRFGDHDAASTRDFVRTVNASPDILFLGMVLKDDGRHIGNIKLGPVDAHHLRAEIGIIVGDKQMWGKGFASEAIAALTEHAFGDLGLHKLTAGSYGGNEGSVGAFLKCGFAVEGRLPSHWACDGEWQDHVALGKINPSCPAPKEGGHGA